MKFQGALVQKQSVSFGIIIVRPCVLNDSCESASIRGFGICAFGAVPNILMSQDSRDVPAYLGRQNIVNFFHKDSGAAGCSLA